MFFQSCMIDFSSLLCKPMGLAGSRIADFHPLCFAQCAKCRGLATPKVQVEARWHGSGGQRPVQYGNTWCQDPGVVAVEATSDR